MIDSNTQAKKLDLLGAMLISTTKIRAQLCHFSIINGISPSLRGFDLDGIYGLLDQIDKDLEGIQGAVKTDPVAPEAQLGPQTISCPSCGGAPHNIPSDPYAILTCRYCGSSWQR